MFKRLITDDIAILFGIIAFGVSFAIYIAFFIRSLRMKKPQLKHFENLPFVTENPAQRHDV